MATDRARSIRVELIVSLAVVLVMAIVSLVFVAELVGQRRHDTNERTHWTEHTRSLATLVDAARDASGRIASERARRLIQQDLGVSAALVSIELFEHHGGSPSLLVAAGLPDPALTPPGVEPGTSDLNGRIVVTHTLSGDPSYVLRTAAEPSSWSRGTTWGEILLISGGVALLLLVLGSALVEVQVVRPLRALREAADRVALGDLGARVPETGSRELVTVAAGFNRMTAALGSQRDELQTQSEALRRNEHMAAVGRLSSGVAHEVGNPLAALVGYTDLLLGDSDLGDESRELLERVRSMTQRIQDIVSQLLDYSRQRPNRLGMIELRPVVDETVALVRAHPGAAGVTIDVEGMASAWGDEGHLSQILLNLLLNGARAARSAEEPRVRVAIHATGDVYLDVADNGAGVPEDLREKVFEPFFTTQPSGTGTGLGLAISAGLAQGMEGSIRLLERGDVTKIPGGGPGACFRVALRQDPPSSEGA